MNKSMVDMLRIKSMVNGKEVYVRPAKDVADYHDVHVNAVYASRRKKDGADKLDKLMAFDEAVRISNCSEDVGLSMRGGKESLMESLGKVMTDGENYIVVCTKEKDDD